MIHKPKPSKIGGEPPKIVAVGMSEGIMLTMGMAQTIERRPMFIGVFGMEDSGKSFLISSLIKGLNLVGITSNGFHSSMRAATIRHIARQITDTPDVLPGALLFHCPYERRAVLDADQEGLLKLIIGRGMDISIGIYNPHYYLVPGGEYDLVINNPESRRETAK